MYCRHCKQLISPCIPPVSVPPPWRDVERGSLGLAAPEPAPLAPLVVLEPVEPVLVGPEWVPVLIVPGPEGVHGRGGTEHEVGVVVVAARVNSVVKCGIDGLGS